MRNRKLYESVEKLVSERKQMKPTKKTFVVDFCQQQLHKKKLIPKDHSSKINDIMKNFQSIHTYINVDHLIECINQLHIQEIKKLHSQKVMYGKFHPLKARASQHKRYASENDEEGRQILLKAHTLLKNYYANHTKEEDEKLAEVIGAFEEASTALSEKISSLSGITTFYNLQKKNKFEDKKGSTKEEDKQNWNFYENPIQQWEYLKKIDKGLQEPSGWIRSTESSQLCKKRKRMFHLARIYLHMILEDQHKQKWSSYDKKINKYHKQRINTEKSVKLKRKVSIFCDKKSVKRNLFSPKSRMSIQEKQKLEEKLLSNSDSRASYTKKQAPPKKSRMIHFQNQDKAQAMKKMDNFLQDLEEDELMLKNQKKRDMVHLQKFAQKINGDKIKSSRMMYWQDDEKINEIKQALKRQDSKKRIQVKKKGK